MSKAFLKLSQVRELQLEITTICNAACPCCPRTGLKELPRQSLTPEDIRTVLPIPVASQLRRVILCGTYGDPLASPWIAEVLEYLSSCHIPRVTAFTNGSLKSPTFFRQIAKLGIDVVFSIDGLENTNSIYRRNTQWHIIMENAESFITAGGKASWHFLVFRHNEHQIEQAKGLAEKMGFENFQIKLTDRTPDDKLPISGNYRNNFSEIDQIKSKNLWQVHLKNTNIQCFAQKTQSLYIDFKGRLWPCCWLGGPQFPLRKEVQTQIRKWPEDFNSLFKYSWQEILEHQWFRNQIPNGFEPGSLSRMPTCASTCGEKPTFATIGKNVSDFKFGGNDSLST